MVYIYTINEKNYGAAIMNYFTNTLRGGISMAKGKLRL